MTHSPYKNALLLTSVKEQFANEAENISPKFWVCALYEKLDVIFVWDKLLDFFASLLSFNLLACHWYEK